MGEGEIFDCIAASVRRDQLGPDLNISGLSCNSPADWAERNAVGCVDEVAYALTVGVWHATPILSLLKRECHSHSSLVSNQSRARTNWIYSPSGLPLKQIPSFGTFADQ
jgi:hypothetical protein